MTKLTRSFLFLCIAVIAALGGCFSPWKGDEANLTLVFGSSENKRALISDGEIPYLEHTIEFSGPSGYQSVPVSMGVSSVNVSLNPGRWEITVSAYSDNMLWYEGYKTVDLKPGRNSVSINMDTPRGLIIDGFSNDNMFYYVFVVDTDKLEYLPDDDSYETDLVDFVDAVGIISPYMRDPVFSLYGFNKKLNAKIEELLNSNDMGEINSDIWDDFCNVITANSKRWTGSGDKSVFLINLNNMLDQKIAALNFTNGVCRAHIDQFENIGIGDVDAEYREIEAIRAYLKSEDSGIGTISDPVELRVKINFGDFSGSNIIWQQLLIAIEESQKYVSLDLSGCTIDGQIMYFNSASGDGMRRIVNFVLPDSAMIIPGAASFSGFSALKSITARNIETVGDSTFWECTKLEYVSFENATKIEARAFGSCDSLTTMHLDSVREIGEEAFSNATFENLTIWFGTTPPLVARDLFSGSAGNVSVYVPAAATAYGNSPTDNLTDNWGNAFRGGGCSAAATSLDGEVNTGITLTIAYASY